MEGVVKISDFMEHLHRNGLVIAPAKMVEKDLTILRRLALKKRLLTLKEVTDAELWGKLTKNRVRQLAVLHARDGEYIRHNGMMKMTKALVERVARVRGIEIKEL
jgi:hypothetical protein